MHNNYHFLKHLSKEIAQKLQTSWSMGYPSDVTTTNVEGMKLAEAFSQNKDELVLGFYSGHEEFYIKSVLRPDFACLSFTQEFFRAKRNSVDLFKVLQGKRVQHVVQHINERAFSILFEQGYALLFKMHGGRSNVIMFEQGDFVISFHKKMGKDQVLKLMEMDRVIGQTFADFEREEGNVRALYPTLGKDVGKWLEAQGVFNMANLLEQWDIIQKNLQDIEKAGFYIYFDKGLPKLLTFLRDPDYKEHYDGAIEAINNFYYQYVKISSLEKQREKASRVLNKRIKQTQNYLDKTYGKLADLDDSNKNEEIANIIMANLHVIPKRAKTVELFDFYHDTQRTIKLKEDLSPQKNAEVYYRKAKNARIEIQKLEENIARKEREKKEYEKHLAIVMEIDNFKELRKYLKNNRLSTSTNQAAQVDKFPFKRFDYQGFEIWIGKNSKNNDLLTQKYAYKEDLWLHAKDVSGSHVVIKYQAGKSFPTDVIEKAASLAAYYSKRSSDTLCPVIVTPKKFVRKTKDLVDGQVIVDKEEVIMVVPEKFE
ncbi:NFACT RNA binding domain-containing protein [Microscilla marina]|uniref:NFACT RNA-binding domain-containing protein n=1 Tax=Microscilla marina ATCC 23134 TaxID=313606 RepID=A1ZZ84_MICM2|nr:NFACT RNA binding domain-containing protein [Microscilla marina]EAY24285.1 conserved hypothetical protein [Microscilla marina ATCC 23134]